MTNKEKVYYKCTNPDCGYITDKPLLGNTPKGSFAKPACPKCQPFSILMKPIAQH